MKLLNFKKVLCASPHPDDVEYSMAATIINHPDTLFELVCLTNGTSTDKNEGRLGEVKAFWENLNLPNVIVPKTSVVKAFEYYNTAQWSTLMDVLHKDHDAIFTTSACDTHQEHVFTNHLVKGTSRKNRISIVEYKSPSTTYDWVPNCFIPCNEAYGTKVRALLDSFQSQLDKLYFQEDIIEAFHTDYNYLKKGPNALIEQFRIQSFYL